MEGMDLGFFCVSVTLSLFLLTAPFSNRPSPTTLARRALLTVIEARPDAFSYKFLGVRRSFEFKTYGQLLCELAYLDFFPREFREELEKELENLLNHLLPVDYRLTFKTGAHVLQVGKGGKVCLSRESLQLTVPSLPPNKVELVLELFA